MAKSDFGSKQELQDTLAKLHRLGLKTKVIGGTDVQPEIHSESK